MKFIVKVFAFSMLLVSKYSYSQGKTQPLILQGVFEIQTPGNNYPEKEINEVFNGVDYCGMINPSQSYVIKLDDGAEIKVLSHMDIISKGETVSFDCVRAENYFDSCSWSIKEGILMKIVESKTVKK